MALFDVSKYEIPNPKNVDIEKTKANLGFFMTAYLAARCRVGQPREPKLTANFSPVPPSTVNNGHAAEQMLIENEEAKEEFEELHNLFIKGYASIQHPFKPEITKRRKKVFYNRYILGKTIYATAQDIYVSEETVKQESTMGIIQFASALELVVFS